jgi:hypothetical protein
LRINANLADNIRKVYDKTKSPADNLANMGLVADPNATGKAEAVNANSAFLGYITNLTSVENKKKVSLSLLDINYAKANIEKHGENYKAMERDMKTNYMQHTARQMEALVKRYQRSITEDNEDEGDK